MSVSQQDVGGDDLSEKKVFTLVFTLNSIVIADEPNFPENFFAVLTFIGKSYRIDFKQRVSQIGCEDLVIETTEDDFRSKISTSPLLIEVVKLIDGEEFNYCKAEVMYSDKLLQDRFCVKDAELIQADTPVGTTSICLGIQTEEMRAKNDPCILATHSPSFKELLQTLYAEYCIDPSEVESSSNCKLDALRNPKPNKFDHSSEESFKWCKDSSSSLDIPPELTCQELFGSDASKFCGCGKRDPQTCKPVRPYSCGAAKHFPGCWDRHKQPDNISNDDIKKSVTEIIKNVCREYNVKPCPANSIEPGCTCKSNKSHDNNSARNSVNCKTPSVNDYKNIIKNTYNDSMRAQKGSPAVPSNIMDICQEKKPEDFDLDAILRKTARSFDDNLCNMSFKKPRKPKRVLKEKDNPHLTQIMHQLNGIKDLIKECCDQDPNMQKMNKSRKNRGGRRPIKSAPTRTASLVKNPCMNSKTTIEQRKRSHAANRYAYNFGNRNTGIVLGHKHCKDDSPLVPKNMGWLWNINTYGIDKMRPGWRPGAVLKCIKDYLCEYLNPCAPPVCPPKDNFFNFKYEHIDGGPTVPRKPRNCAKIGTLACNLHDKNINTDAVTDSMIDIKNAKLICDQDKDEKPKGKKGKKGKGKGKGGKGKADKGAEAAKGAEDDKAVQAAAPVAQTAPAGQVGGQAGNGGGPGCGQVYDECAQSCFRLLGQGGGGPCGGGQNGGQYGGQNGGQFGGQGGGQFGGQNGGQFGGQNGSQFGGQGGGQFGGPGGGPAGVGGGQGGNGFNNQLRNNGQGGQGGQGGQAGQGGGPGGAGGGPGGNGGGPGKTNGNGAVNGKNGNASKLPVRASTAGGASKGLTGKQVLAHQLAKSKVEEATLNHFGKPPKPNCCQPQYSCHGYCPQVNVCQRCPLPKPPQPRFNNYCCLNSCCYNNCTQYC